MIWFNPRHPQTMQAAVILGYISGVFGLLESVRGDFLLLLAALAVLGGAFGTANNKRIGWVLLTGGAALLLLLRVATVVMAAIRGEGMISTLLRVLAEMLDVVFPTALFAAAVHIQTREYMKAWFD